MNDYSWPDDRQRLAERRGVAWSATVEGLPIGTPVVGEVIGRQPFGIFIRIDGVPDAVGLAEVTAMPRDAVLPPMGARVAGVVTSHTEHNRQVRVRLDN